MTTIALVYAAGVLATIAFSGWCAHRDAWLAKMRDTPQFGRAVATTSLLWPYYLLVAIAMIVAELVAGDTGQAP